MKLKMTYNCNIYILAFWFHVFVCVYSFKLFSGNRLVSQKRPLKYRYQNIESRKKISPIKSTTEVITDSLGTIESTQSETSGFQRFEQPTEILDMIDQRTIECLDFQIILDALCNNAVTILGRSLCRQKQGNSSLVIRQEYAMIDQLYNHIAMLPLRSNMDIYPVLNAIEHNLSPPEIDDLFYFTMHIEQIIELYDYMYLHRDKLNLFSSLTSQLVLPLELKEMFTKSFDDEGNLSSEKFPVLKKLRSEIETLRGKIIQTLKTMLQSFEMRDKLADSGFTEIEGRYVLMLKNTYKKGVGIVHGSSNTGRSLYVEPLEIVEPTNEMKSLQAQLRAEEALILSDMCQSISKHRKEIKTSTKAVAVIDIYRAKAKLGHILKGVIPDVYDEGEMSCIDAKHPILLLRGVDAIGNNIFFNESCKSWVISGPNAGGKTIILKTAGLFALMVRYTIPLPARYGCRVDMMYVMADIGDMQTVSGDLSTFSGHLVVCREMLKKLENMKYGQPSISSLPLPLSSIPSIDENEHEINQSKYIPQHSIVLLDEIGTGTDPAQGAALAQSILEELLSLNARVIVTTHYQRIKELAASDSRFRIAAMEFVDNRPTYKLRLGSVGESFALEAAKRMNLPSKVLTRAELLLDDETRRIVSLQKKLEEETNKAREKQKELENIIKSMDKQQADIDIMRQTVQNKITKLRDGVIEEFVSDLKKREADFNFMVSEAKLNILDTSGKITTQDKTKLINEMKTVIKQVRVTTEKEVVENRIRGDMDLSLINTTSGNAADNKEPIAIPLPSTDRVEIGQRLVILEKGSLFGVQGFVSQKDKGRGRIILSVAGMEVKIERHLLGYPTRSGPLNLKASDLKYLNSGAGVGSTLASLEDAGFTGLKNMSAKDKRILKMLQEELVDPDKLTPAYSGKNNGNVGRSTSSSRSGSSGGSVTSSTVVPQSLPITTQRTLSNTIDVRNKNLVEAQQIAMNCFEKLFDQLYGDSDEKNDPYDNSSNNNNKSSKKTPDRDSHIIYLHIGKNQSNINQQSQSLEEVTNKLRAWLRGLSLISRVQTAESSQGGDAYIAVELAFDSVN